MLGLFAGALHLFVLINACLRSLAGKWLVGALAAVLRTFLLIAVTMASARIRVAGAEPSTSYFVALVAGPVIALAMLVLAYVRRTKLPAGSEEESVADRIVKSWLAVAIIDAMFVVVGFAASAIGSR